MIGNISPRSPMTQDFVSFLKDHETIPLELLFLYTVLIAKKLSNNTKIIEKVPQ